jgi:ketosteroid isomerase-like protein
VALHGAGAVAAEADGETQEAEPMSNRAGRNPLGIVERLQQAQNAHDLEGFVGCFDPDYRSEQPAHPDRAFTGREQVRKNWGSVFRDMPDFRSELLQAAAADDTVWSEWHWTGTPVDGGRFEWCGVIILGVRDDRIAWARLYMGPVEAPAGGIDAAVRSMTHGQASTSEADPGQT